MLRLKRKTDGVTPNRFWKALEKCEPPLQELLVMRGEQRLLVKRVQETFKCAKDMDMMGGHGQTSSRILSYER